MVHRDRYAEWASRGRPAKLMLCLASTQNDFAIGNVLKTTDENSFGETFEKSGFGSHAGSNRRCLR
jgi:hypothetical protein